MNCMGRMSKKYIGVLVSTAAIFISACSKDEPELKNPFEYDGYELNSYLPEVDLNNIPDFKELYNVETSPFIKPYDGGPMTYVVFECDNERIDAHMLIMQRAYAEIPSNGGTFLIRTYDPFLKRISIIDDFPSDLMKNHEYESVYHTLHYAIDGVKTTPLTCPVVTSVENPEGIEKSKQSTFGKIVDYKSDGKDFENYVTYSFPKNKTGKFRAFVLIKNWHGIWMFNMPKPEDDYFVVIQYP